MFNDQPPQDSERGSQEPKVNLNSPDAKARRKSLKRLTLILLIGGLIVGAILSVGVVFVLNRLGLTDSPNEIEQIEE